MTSSTLILGDIFEEEDVVVDREFVNTKKLVLSIHLFHAHGQYDKGIMSHNQFFPSLGGSFLNPGA